MITIEMTQQEVILIVLLVVAITGCIAIGRAYRNAVHTIKYMESQSINIALKKLAVGGKDLIKLTPPQENALLNALYVRGTKAVSLDEYAEFVLWRKEAQDTHPQLLPFIEDE